MTGKGIGKQGRLALVFYLRVIIVCRRLATTYGKAAVKGNLALGLGSKVQGVIHIELILKDQRKRGNFIGQEERGAADIPGWYFPYVVYVYPFSML